MIRCTSLLATILLTCVSLVDAAEIRGRVLSKAGAPIPSAVISITKDGSSVTAQANAAGAFVMNISEPVPAMIELGIRADGFRNSTISVDPRTKLIEIVLNAQEIFSGEVNVTGTRAVAGETPVTMTNIGREDIERVYWGQDVPMALAQVPSYYAYNDNGNGIGYSYFTLRGFDMRRTAVSLNGVPLNGATSHSVYFVDLADFLQTTEDIQVQRGVGTSMYGNSALGGSIDFATRHPLNEQRLRLTTNFGSFDTSKFSLEYDSGLSENGWSSTFRYSKISSDGYREQSWLEAWNYYAAVEHYGERSTTRIVLFGGPEDTHLAYEGVSEPYLEGEITGDQLTDRRYNPLTYENEVDHFFQPHYQIHNSWRLSENITVDNTFFFFEGDGYFNQYGHDKWMPEYGLTPIIDPGGDVIDTTDIVRKRSVDEWDGGWIPSVDWSHGEGRGLMKAGLAIRLHSSHHLGQVTWAQYSAPDFGPNHSYYDYQVSKTTLQPFIQETWEFTDQWRLMAGLTYTSHEYEMHDDQFKGVEFTEKYNYLLPRLGVTYQLNSQWSLFGNVSRGAREPAFRDIYNPQDYWSPDPLDLAYEELTDFELGGRHTWKTGFAAMNLYVLDFDNAIVASGGLDNNGVPVTANGAVVTQKGIEFESAWMPVPRWGAQLSLAWSDATFDEFTEYDWDGNVLDRSGNALAANPEFLGNLQLIGAVGPVDFMLTIRHVSQFYLDNTEDNKNNPELKEDPDYVNVVNPAYTTADFSIRADLGPKAAGFIAAKGVLLDLRINNITNELYTTFGYNWPEPVWIPAATRAIYGGFVIDW